MLPRRHGSAVDDDDCREVTKKKKCTHVSKICREEGPVENIGMSVKGLG